MQTAVKRFRRMRSFAVNSVGGLSSAFESLDRCKNRDAKIGTATIRNMVIISIAEGESGIYNFFLALSIDLIIFSVILIESSASDLSMVSKSP